MNDGFAGWKRDMMNFMAMPMRGPSALGGTLM